VSNTENWKNVRLGDVCETTSGGTPSRKQKEYYEGNIPWVKSGELNKGLILNTEEKVTAEAIKNSSAKVFPKGTLLIALYGATIGKLAFLGVDAATNQAVCGIFEGEKVDLKYLYHFLFSKRRDLIKQGIGGAQPNISQTILKNLSLPVPPLPEQHQIVEKIEELFSELYKSIENLKTAQQQLKVYRQAVLKWAFEGKLTNNDVKDGELPDGWEWVRLADICKTTSGGTPSRKNVNYYNGNIPWVKSGELNKGLILNTEEKITEEAVNNSSAKIFPKGTLLIALYGATIGKLAFLGIDAATNQAICGIFKNEIVDSQYLYYYLRFSKSKLIGQGIGGAQPNISQGILKDLDIPFAKVSEQQQIVQEIESRLSVCDKMEETISTSLQQAEALRQSILKKAFEGKLVKKEENLTQAKVVSINIQCTDRERKVLAGYIIFVCHKDRYFGRTKFQKTLYLCENFAQLNFNTAYLKKAAGPLDASFIYPFIKEGEEKNWFIEKTETTPYYFEPLDSIGELTSQYPSLFREASTKINFVINQLKEKSTDESELIATIYAVWNNYIIEEKTMDSNLLISEIYDWSENKLKFNQRVILSTWDWMKEVGLAPVGFGKLINKQSI
jgi:type I restriction enzyme S subunit